jgi:queuine tRNA-ribosyltransferase
VTFKSTYDGSLHRFTPEEAVRVQQLLGADIQMVLDVCTALPAPETTVRNDLERTTQWAQRARAAHERPDQSLFGIVQGGISESMRVESAERTVAMNFDGYGIGGLSVGETREEMLPALAAAISRLPKDQPRYLMGVGDPASLVEGVALGVDQFDCVLQSRLGRHGTALTSTGKLQIKNAQFALDNAPIDEKCSCWVCAQHSRGYIRHLARAGEPSAARLVTIHNIAWTLQLMESMRDAIRVGTFENLRKEVLAVWG